MGEKQVIENIEKLQKNHMGILKIFIHDIKKIFTNPIAAMIAIGVMVLPSLYAWFNIQACWDPYGNTGNLEVAVVSVDRGCELKGIELNLGDQIIENLAGNSQIGWQFVDKKTAKKGVKDGTYYAAVIIPKNFSENMISVLKPEIIRPQIEYYVNEKKNAIAPKITNSGVNVVQQTVNQAFIAQSVELISNAVITLSNDLEDVDLSGFSQKDFDAQKLKNAVTLLESTDDSLAALQSTIKSFEQTSVSVDVLLDSVEETLKTTRKKIKGAATDKSSLDGAMDNISAAGTGMENTLEMIFHMVEMSVSDIRSSVSATLDSADEKVSAAAAADVETRLNTMISVNKQMINILKSNRFLYKLASVKKLIGKLDEVNASLENAKDSAENISTKVSSGKTAVKSDINKLKRSLASAGDFMGMAADMYAASVRDRISDSVSAAETAANKIMSAFSSVQTVVPLAENALTSTRTTLNTATDSFKTVRTTIKNTRKSIHNMEDFLTDLAKRAEELQKKLEEGISTDLRSAMERKLGIDFEDYQNAPEAVAEFLASPVILDTHRIYPIENYGSGMAPFYTILCLWVGGLVLASIIKVHVQSDGELNVEYYRQHQKYYGRYLTYLLFAIFQALIVCLGDILILKIQCPHPVLFCLTGVFASIVFSNVIYTLTISFDDVGKAIAVIMLVLQVAGAGGTFPVELTPSFFNAINPFMPFTHGINAMREAVGGLYGYTYLTSMAKMGVYLPFSLLFGTVFRKPLVATAEFFAKKLKETGVM